MQERYLGDVHDFIKYAFLRHLGRNTGFRLGLNWYLTDPMLVDKIGNNDGAKRFHLDGPSWQDWDAQLHILLQEFSEPKDRQLHHFYKLCALPPDTIYVDTQVSKAKRIEWHRAALAKLASTDHVFLDPDNGLEVKSATGKRRPKYALYEEIRDYVADGKAVTCIQFARQCSPEARAIEVRNACLNATSLSSVLPVLRCRAAPNILFISLAPPDKAKPLKEAINSFAVGSPPMDNVGSRVMLIE